MRPSQVFGDRLCSERRRIDMANKL